MKHADEGPSVLVVDDDAVHRNIVFHVLHSAGYHVESVEDGVDAIEALKWRTYSAILLDLAMEVFSGERVIDFIERTYPETLQSIIILTGLPDARKRLSGRRVYSVHEKPLKQKDLLAAVAECVAANPHKRAGK